MPASLTLAPGQLLCERIALQLLFRIGDSLWAGRNAPRERRSSMKRATQRADSALRLIDELLSGRKLQRSTRLALLKLRRELQEIREERDVGRRDLVRDALRWAVAVTRLYEIFDRLID